LRTQTSPLAIWKGHTIVVVWTALIYFNPILNRVVRGLSPYPSEWGEDDFRGLVREYVSRTFDSPGADANNIFVRFLLTAGIALALLFVVAKLRSSWKNIEPGTYSGQDRELNQYETLLLATLVLVTTLLPVALLALQVFTLSLPYARNFLYLAPFVWLAALWGWQSLFLLVIRQLRIDSRHGTDFYLKLTRLTGSLLAILMLIVYLPAVQSELRESDSRNTSSQAWMSKELASYLQLTVPADASVKVAGGCIEPRLSYYLRDSEVLAQFDRDYECEMDAGGSSVIFIPTWDITLEHFDECNPDLKRVELIFASEAVEAWRYDSAEQSQ
jgi:hypothetical protein